MSCRILLVVLLFTAGLGQSQDTVYLRYGRSKNDTIVYKRIIDFDNSSKLYQVRDYYPGGQIEMEAWYSSFDPVIKESWQCNYLTNTKQGPYNQWYENGQIKFSGTFKNGLAHGRDRWWYQNGRIEADEGRKKGQLHGRVRYWTPEGVPEHDLNYKKGVNQNPKKVTYPYLVNLPKEYESDTLKRWPLIIYLHGGSQRGTVLKRLYDSGIPDQVYRGREFPFIIISPLCPLHLRWSTEEWFEEFFRDITQHYRIDPTRVYLTGLSLGASGTWYLAEKYPEKFAAIAPISGFTHGESNFIKKKVHRLDNIPVWAFHGKIDDVVPFEETEKMVRKLEGKNPDLKFKAEPAVGHWLHWMVYPGEELYAWFLTHIKN